MYEVLCETMSGPIVVDRVDDPDEGYALACNLQAEGKQAYMQEGREVGK